MVIYPELPPAAILLVDDMPGNIRILREAVKDLPASQSTCDRRE